MPQAVCFASFLRCVSTIMPWRHGTHRGSAFDCCAAYVGFDAHTYGTNIIMSSLLNQCLNRCIFFLKYDSAAYWLFETWLKCNMRFTLLLVFKSLDLLHQVTSSWVEFLWMFCFKSICRYEKNWNLNRFLLHDVTYLLRRVKEFNLHKVFILFFCLFITFIRKMELTILCCVCVLLLCSVYYFSVLLTCGTR